MPKFTKSNAIGRSAESQVRQLLAEAGINAEENTSKEERLFFDIKCDDFTIEVKYDVMAARTGNVAIEFFNSKKSTNSGLYATKAEVWAHCFTDGDIWLASTARMREYCTPETCSRVVYAAGDDNADIMLFPKDKILTDIFTLVTKDNVKDVINKLISINCNT